jgi:hypothetical protein
VLVADGNEFELEAVGDGVYQYVTEAGDFTTVDPTKRISCFIRMDNNDTYGDEVWLTEEFPIYVILRPTENL